MVATNDGVYGYSKEEVAELSKRIRPGTAVIWINAANRAKLGKVGPEGIWYDHHGGLKGYRVQVVYVVRGEERTESTSNPHLSRVGTE